MRKQIVPVILLLMLTVWISPAAAIVYGELDNGRHPNTGLLSVTRSDGSHLSVCSGILVEHQRAFLTAGHCTALLEDAIAQNVIQLKNVKISFDAENADEKKLLDVAEIHTHPEFNDALPASDPHDLGLVILKNKAPGNVQPAKLPVEGFLDNLKLEGAEFTVVGYGAFLNTGDKPSDVQDPDGQRRVAVSGYQKLFDVQLRLSQNQSHDEGGSCFRDSGGPVFLNKNGTETLVAIVNSGDSACVSMSTNYRLDIPTSLDFIKANLPK